MRVPRERLLSQATQNRASPLKVPPQRPRSPRPSADLPPPVRGSEPAPPSLRSALLPRQIRHLKILAADKSEFWGCMRVYSRKNRVPNPDRAGKMSGSKGDLGEDAADGENQNPEAFINVRRATTIIQLKDLNPNSDGYWRAWQWCSSQCTPLNVVVRQFDSDMKRLFSFRQTLEHDNFQRVHTMAPKDGQKKFMISYEPVQKSLITWLEERNEAINDGDDATNYNPIIGGITKQTLHAVTSLHKKGKFYGPIDPSHIFLNFDPAFEKTDPAHYKVKLTFPHCEEWYRENIDGDFEGHSLHEDLSGVASILNSLHVALMSSRGTEFGYLQSRLMDTTCSDTDILETFSCMWKVEKKKRFLRFVINRMPSNVAQIPLKWKIKFQNETRAAGEHLRVRGKRAPVYNDTVSDFVRFGNNTCKHFKEYSVETKKVFGGTETAFLMRLEGHYEGLFDDLADAVGRGVVLMFTKDSY